MATSLVMRFPDGARLYVLRPNEVAVGDTIEQDGSTWIVETVDHIADGRLEITLAPVASPGTRMLPGPLAVDDAPGIS